MIAIRMRGDDGINIPVPKGNEAPDAREQKLGVPPAVDHDLMLSLLDQDGIPLADIKKDDLGLLPGDVAPGKKEGAPKSHEAETQGCQEE